MVRRRTSLALAVVSSLALALPIGAAQAASNPPVAQSAGGGAPPTNPAIVGVPLARADKAMSNAADAVDAGNGAQAQAPLQAVRRYMLRAYNGAQAVIAATPAVPPQALRAPRGTPSSATFVKMARRAIRASHSGTRPARLRIKAKAAGGAVGPTLADGPTAVFNVLTGQYNVATAAAGMLPDVQGTLLQNVTTALNTAIILRNRLVQVVHTASPPAPPAALVAHAAGTAVGTGFDTVMPGLTLLVSDEIQQLQAMAADTTVPAGSKAGLTAAIAADQQINTQLNTWWPPVPADAG
jgi:hypothetical protein